MKKMQCLVIIVVCVVGIFAGFASAEDIGVQPYGSDLIKTYTVQISSNSDGLITATARITTNWSADKLGFPKIRIEKKQGSSWTSVKSTSRKYKTNAGAYSYQLTYQGTEGTQYRAYAEFYAKDGSTEDSRSKTSITITGK